jgi:hypothetical protein
MNAIVITQGEVQRARNGAVDAGADRVRRASAFVDAGADRVPRTRVACERKRSAVSDRAYNGATP